MGLLEDAYKMAKEYSDKLGPIEKWLTGAEKKVKDMETVPTEEDQIQKRIKEHDQILGKQLQSTFNDLTDLTNLTDLGPGQVGQFVIKDWVEVERTEQHLDSNMIRNVITT